MSLPNGYKRLEYIQSSGTQWIDTGVKAKNDTKVIADCEITYGTGWVKILGSYEAGAFFSWWANASNIYAYYGAEEKRGVGATGKHILTANGNMWSDYVNDFSFSASSFTATINMYLFSVNGGGTYDNAPMKLYSCQIYDNDTLVRDYVPCQKPDGTIGLWDDVNGVFYGNAGTGTFTAGSVLAIAVDASEITKLEYIESSGTQYINSNFKANQNTRVVINFEYISGDVVFGAYDTAGANGFGLQAASNKWYTYYGKSSGYSSTAVVANTRLVADINKNVATLNGAALRTATVNSFTGANPLIISGLYNVSAPGFLTALKIYSCQIYDNGTLVRDYIAAKLSDGTVGLYDKLHGLLYINMGTGTFTAGPVVASPSIFVNIDGIWKPINNIYVNINNIWQKST